ncbi:SusC/RagA family TonB-linked outer membrane protein [Hymenobacter endophyticus]|uniref:SusC/RagA family TonB-linked outer membrane protein n=1 Tax=Hymenobacter endophyticus TaxID=3076335 RepID=A0ABU3TJZ2_9BACT|nr:SusC/RagA family TonB-linked outer membrane protein [Hymenobacter endophyticus]MDU0371535.1 SusC/RagA family TonB-linked outer membrane protein [Hymenobacter endophyticus]
MKHPYLAKLALPLLCAGVSVSSAYAQGTGTVSGRILDEKGEGMPGVTVIIEGTTLGGSTNSDGTFSIQNVPAGPRTLVLSFVGYTTQRQSITVTTGQNTAVNNFTLSENTTLLNEAVVIGYGTQRKQDLTGAVEQISEKQFVKGQVTNPEQLVQGKVAGVQITTGGGAPGANSQILIRGGSSLSASNSPLIIIDGVPVDNNGLAGATNPLSLINPNDIESITVLKDASSTAIYGVRASNGVILVTTKKGVQGDAFHVNVSTQQSIATVAKYSDVLSADEFRELVNARGTAGQKATLGTASTDWQREIYRSAYTSDNNVSISGNAGKVPYRVSGGYLSQEGLLKANDLKRFSGALSLTPVLLDGNLRVTLNVKGSWIDNNFSNQGAVGNAVTFDPTQPVQVNGTEGNPFGLTPAQLAAYGGYTEFNNKDDNGVVSLNTLSPRNPVGLINQRRDRSTVKRSIGNIQLDYKLPFLSGLSANLNLGYDIQRGRGTTFVPATAGSDFNRQGVNNNYSQDLNNTLLEAYAKYERTLGPGRAELLAGYSYQKFENRSYVFDDFRADRSIFAPVSLSYSGEDTYLNSNVLLGFFGRLNYNIADKYLFTGTFRADGTSRFNPDHFGYFPSGAFAWRIKGEDFLKDASAISDLKIRLGYGQTGQQDLGTNFYPFLANLSLSNLTAQYQLGYNADGTPRFLRTLRPDQYNRDITWETTTTYNAGLDYGFFGGRFFGSVDFYKRDTKDLLNFRTVAALAGLSNGGTFNTGSLTNKGVELIANVDVVKGDRLNITVNANATYNQNRLTKLTGSDSPNDVGQLTGGIGGGVGNTIQVNTVGYSTQTFYVNQQVYGQNGKPLEGVYVDRDGSNTITSSDRYRYKSARPDYVLGGGANISYGGANLAFTLRSNLGNYVYNNNRASSFYDLSTSGFVPNRNREVLNSGFSSAQYFSDYFVENGSFLRMENVTLGYNFGEMVRKGTNLSLSFAVQNVFLVTKYKGLDPEVIGGIDNTIYPRPRTFTVGLNLGI